MTIRVALRSLTARPVRSAVLACGFGFGIGVMAGLLFHASRTGAKAVIVPELVGGDEGVNDYFDLIERWVSSLAAAFGASPHP